MSNLVFTPISGSTFSYPDTVVAAAASLPFGNQQAGSTAYSQINSNTITGPNAADFHYGSDFSWMGPFYGNDGGTGTIVFTPSAIGVRTATATIVYENGQNGTPNGDIRTVTYNLTGSGISNPSPPPATETTSLLQVFRYLLVPSLGTTGKVLSYYNAGVFDDSADAATYIYKAEDIIADRVPTTRRVIVTYIDIGIATLHVTVNAVNDNGVIVSQQSTVTIGTIGASGLLATAYADLAVTGYRPQITIFRAAGGGSIAISHVVATGTVEKEVTL